MTTCQAPDCGSPIDQDRRSDSVYCSNACKRRAMRARKKERKSSNFISSFGIPLQSHEAAGPSHAADDRFHALIAADEAARQPRVQAKEWAAYAKRHGTIHPDEQAARIARGQQARSADWAQGTARFTRTSSTVAEKARESRARQQRPVIDPGPGSDDNDPDMMEPPEMIDMGNWRSGRGHWSGAR